MSITTLFFRKIILLIVTLPFFLTFVFLINSAYSHDQHCMETCYCYNEASEKFDQTPLEIVVGGPTVEDFLKAGFYRVNNNSKDDVKCIFCQKSIFDWKKEDNPLKEHLKLSYKKEKASCPLAMAISSACPKTHHTLKTSACSPI